MRHSKSALNKTILKDKMRLHPDVTHYISLEYYSKIPILNKAIHGNKYSLKFAVYKGSKVKMNVYCKKCKKLFKTAPHHFLGSSNPTGCPKCGKERGDNLKRKSETQFKKELKQKNPSVVLEGKYLNKHTKTMFRCIKCNISSLARPSDKLDGAGCPHCKPSTHEHLRYNPAKIYSLKITKGGKTAYKIGVTTKPLIVGTGNTGRYASTEDKNAISEVSYINIDTLIEAERIEHYYKNFTIGNSKYRGKKGMLQNMGNTELFKKPIDLAGLLKAYDKKYINCKVIKEV